MNAIQFLTPTNATASASIPPKRCEASSRHCGTICTPLTGARSGPLDAVPGVAVSVKPLRESGEQRTVPLAELVATLAAH